MRSAKKLRSIHYTDETLQTSFFDALPCYEKQRRWIAQTHCRNSLFLGGIGTGKTTALVRRSLLMALRHPGLDGAILARTGRDTMQTILPVLFDSLQQFYEATGVQLLVNFVRSEMRLVMIGNSSILLRPYGESVDRLRGLSLAWCGLDELAYARGDSRYIWDVVSGRVRTGDPKKRSVFAATTPNGATGTVGWFMEKQREQAPNFYVAHATIFDNPYLEDGHPCPDCKGEGCDRCGGTGQASEYRDAVRASSSKRYWAQDGLGKVLKSQASVFGDAEYDESKHVIDWTYDPSLPFAVGIDWGEALAYAMIVQFVDHNNHELPAGTWIVCEELICEQISRSQFRQRLLDFIKRRGTPYFIGADRAVPSENRWIRYTINDCHHVKVAESKKVQRVRYGVELLRSMLDPVEGPPRLLFSSSLDAKLTSDSYGIRAQMVNYRYKVNAIGEMLDEPAKLGQEHCVDALRYLAVTSALHEPMHGGRPLPFARLEGPRSSRDERYRDMTEVVPSHLYRR